MKGRHTDMMRLEYIEMIRAAIMASPRGLDWFVVGKPRMLFERQYQPTPATVPNYDGQRFLMVKANGSADVAPTQINVMLNCLKS